MIERLQATGTCLRLIFLALLPVVSCLSRVSAHSIIVQEHPDFSRG